MASTQPVVVLLNIDQEGFAEELMAGQVKALKEKCNQVEARTEGACLRLLADHPRGVFVASAGVIESKYNSLTSGLVAYARGGGTVVLGGLMSSFARPPDFDKWLRHLWTLPWQFGDYHRDDSALNSGYITTQPLLGAVHDLPKLINIKSVYLKNVKATDMVYTMTTSREAQAPVVLAQYGKGHLGWVGDVNFEAPINAVYLAMFGLIGDIDQDCSEPVAVSQTVCKSCGKDADALEAGKVLKRCARCKNASYCSKECQRAEFKVHRTICEL